MKPFDVIIFSILLSAFLYMFWLIFSTWKAETISYLCKMDSYTSIIASSRHRIIDNDRLNGFPVGQVIYIKTIEGINVFYHFDAYQFIPDFLPNEELLQEYKEDTQFFLKAKRPPTSFDDAIELISQYYDIFPDSEAHLYKDDFFNRLPYLLPS